MLQQDGTSNGSGTLDALSDRQLLERFAQSRDAAAYRLLVERHGGLVFRVCQGILRHHHDAEDAFQATFLVLANKAGQIRLRRSLAHWLYGTACRISLKASARIRKDRGQPMAEEPTVPDCFEQVAASDAEQTLHEELSQLPGRYRAPLVLCYLQGKTQREAAQELGLSATAVKGRLQRGRQHLRLRLWRRGIGPVASTTAGAGVISSASAGVASSFGSATPQVPCSLATSTVAAATKFVSGGTLGGAVSTQVLTLAKGELAMVSSTTFVKQAAAVAVTLVVLSVACLLLTGNVSAEKPTGVPVVETRIPTSPLARTVMADVKPQGADSDEPPASAEESEQAPEDAEALISPTVQHVDARSQADDPSDSKSTPGIDNQQADKLAQRVHAQAAAIGKLPSFYYRVRCWHGDVATMRTVDGRSLAHLRTAIDGSVPAEDRIESTYLFAWDEKRFLRSVLLLSGAGDMHRFWTRDEAWERHPRSDGTHFFVRRAGARDFWTEMHFFEYSYLRVTTHDFWWGTNNGVDQCISPVPPSQATYKYLGTEQFGAEMCDVVEAVRRLERLWIGRESGRLRGVLRYGSAGFYPDEPFYKTDAVERIADRSFSSRRAYQKWHSEEMSDTQKIELTIAWNELNFDSNTVPTELIRFSDYRKIAPRVWLPFHEERTVAYHSDKAKGKWRYDHSELFVEEAKTGVDLTEKVAELRPKKGDKIQDQRFAVPVTYEYRPDIPDAEIQQLVAAKQKELAIGRRRLKKLTQPIEAMLGQTAPELPADGWINHKQPDFDDDPYLIHFWATWCGPCKNDLPRLKRLADDGAQIVGLHPGGTSAAKVRKAVKEHALNYPVLLASVEGDDEDRKVAGYPSGVFPYCVLVDSKGRIAAHGFLRSELLAKFSNLRNSEEGEASQ